MGYVLGLGKIFKYVKISRKYKRKINTLDLIENKNFSSLEKKIHKKIKSQGLGGHIYKAYI